MSKKTGKRILVAPLDWGLGHTTRCIPLIRGLEARGHSVIVAGNEQQLSFIKNINANIETVFLDGYNIIYSASDNPGWVSNAMLLPRLYRAVNTEHAWLQHNLSQLNVNGVISDNRYGLYHSDVPSVIITHQLEVQTGIGGKMNRGLQRLHYKYLAKFSGIWVPDIAGKNGLAGRLSHPDHHLPGTHYIGLLSQFNEIPGRGCGSHLLILLSGPEPQRSILDDRLWEQAQAYEGKVIFISGTTDAKPRKAPSHITWYNRLGGNELATLIKDASAVVCRSGYSTIMDLARLQKKGILVPTPGQTEQEYLARHLHKLGFTTGSQKNADLAQWTRDATEREINYSAYINHFADYEPVLTEWAEKL